MVRIPIDDTVLNSYYSIVQDKSTYLGFRIRNGRMCIYSEVNEILYLSMCNTHNADDISIRLPVETMNIMMTYGTLIIEDIINGDTRSEKLTTYDNSGKVVCSVVIASEFADSEEQIAQLLDTVLNEEYTPIYNPDIFKEALSLANIKVKDLGIKGVNFSSGKIFTLGNGFASYRNDPYNLSLVISTSSLREIVKFCKGKPCVNLYRHGGYNMLFDGVNTIAWRRVRSEHYFPIPKTEYTVSTNLNIYTLDRAFKCIRTEVSSCVLNFKNALLELHSQVGIYSIPLEMTPVDVSNITLNYKLFSGVIGNSKGEVLLECNDNTVHLKINGTDYYIGVLK